MKYVLAKITTATLLAAFIVSGCDGQQNQSNVDRAQTTSIQAERDLEIAKTVAEAEYRIYKIENENRLERYERSIEQGKEAIRNETNPGVKARLQARLSEHERVHRNLHREINDFKTSSGENWEEFRENFSDRMDALSDSLGNFPSRMRTTSLLDR